MAGAPLECKKSWNSICRERLVLRRSRLHSGLSQVFLLLFVLLAIVAPTVDAPLAGYEVGNYLSEPDDPQGDAAILVGATLSVAEDPEEEADREDATVLVLADRPCAADAGYRATDAWRPSIPRPSAHPCTGPPIL